MDGIRFILNGTKVNYVGSAADRLLDVLRDTFRTVKSLFHSTLNSLCTLLFDSLSYIRKHRHEFR